MSSRRSNGNLSAARRQRSCRAVTTAAGRRRRRLSCCPLCRRDNARPADDEGHGCGCRLRRKAVLNVTPHAPFVRNWRKLGAGPLSEVKMTIVLSLDPSWSASCTRTCTPDLAVVLGFSVRRWAVKFQSFCLLQLFVGSTHGVCMSSGQRLAKQGACLCGAPKSSVLSTK